MKINRNDDDMDESTRKFLAWHQQHIETTNQKLVDFEKLWNQIQEKADKDIQDAEQEMPKLLERLRNDFDVIFKILENHLIEKNTWKPLLEQYFTDLKQFNSDVLGVISSYESYKIHHESSEDVINTITPHLSFWRKIVQEFRILEYQMKCAIDFVDVIQKRLYLQREIRSKQDEVQSYNTDIQKLLKKKKLRGKSFKRAKKVLFHLDRKQYQFRARIKSYQEYEKKLHSKIFEYQYDIKKKDEHTDKLIALLKQKLIAGELNEESFEGISQNWLDNKGLQKIFLEIEKKRLEKLRSIYAKHQQECQKFRVTAPKS